jgi:hypothetical protein
MWRSFGKGRKTNNNRNFNEKSWVVVSVCTGKCVRSENREQGEEGETVRAANSTKKSPHRWFVAKISYAAL